ncbi:hypothetical protein [Curtobacterium sp. MCLR17_043]|uniref:hypothetical protein n=1 Tax=Curtobacterium sp. MCLR17_043 TaxID=2175627 RepID=UPI0021AC3BD8|nr:hypothetical protein [Curtobacterium sp. MCLR17_043]
MVKRLLCSDVKAYPVPECLEDLRRPEHGVLELPLNVYWGPNSVVDLDTDDGLEKAYHSFNAVRSSQLLKKLMTSVMMHAAHPRMVSAVAVGDCGPERCCFRAAPHCEGGMEQAAQQPGRAREDPRVGGSKRS